MKFNRKKPEKIPMYVYYIIAGIIIIILNMLVVPAVQERSVQKTDYSTFIENVEKGNVTKATVEESYIYYEMKATIQMELFYARQSRWMMLIWSIVCWMRV